MVAVEVESSSSSSLVTMEDAKACLRGAAVGGRETTAHVSLRQTALCALSYKLAVSYCRPKVPKIQSCFFPQASDVLLIPLVGQFLTLRRARRVRRYQNTFLPSLRVLTLT